MFIFYYSLHENDIKKILNIHSECKFKCWYAFHVLYWQISEHLIITHFKIFCSLDVPELCRQMIKSNCANVLYPLHTGMLGLIDQIQNKKNTFIERWSIIKSFLSHILQRESYFHGKQKCGLSRQVVFLYRWLLKQVWT